MKVLINAGPWLPVPPLGYGGIENVVATLVPELRRLGVEVVLATVAESTLAVDERLSVFDTGRFELLQRPYNQVCGIVPAHLHAVRRRLAEGDIDLVHDHVEAAGLAGLAALGPYAPPGLHTLHWDLAKHPELYGTFDGGDRVRVNGVSANQLTHAPAALRAHAVGHVHLATPLADGADRRTPVAKNGYAVVLGRINPGKGQDLAARLAHRAGFDLVLAGPVGPYHRPEDLAAAGPAAAQNPDVRFWQEQVAPHVDGDRVRWVGTVTGQDRDDLVARARAALFPLRRAPPSAAGRARPGPARRDRRGPARSPCRPSGPGRRRRAGRPAPARTAHPGSAPPPGRLPRDPRAGGTGPRAPPARGRTRHCARAGPPGPGPCRG